jgi:hypothetical protein
VFLPLSRFSIPSSLHLSLPPHQASTTTEKMTSEAPPPSYEAASSHAGPRDSSHLAVPGQGTLGRTRSNSAGSYTASSDEEGGERGLSTEERVSMEDSFRELPQGWTREFDPVSILHSPLLPSLRKRD